MVQSKDPKVPVFRPTKEQINGSFEAYINSIEPKCKKLGICKIILPKEWCPRKGGYSSRLDVTISRPIEQTVTGKQGLYQALQLERKAMSLLHDFKPRAEAPENQPPKGAAPEELEREFWRSMCRTPPIYGADVEESLFDPKTKGWNIRNLDSLLTRVLAEKIPGVNTPYLYFGMWRSFFGWHTEDMELHSINYLHFGAPKSWYCIAPEHRQRFETLIKGLVPDMFRICPEFFRHKELLVSPSLLAHYSVPVLKFCQYPGEIVINFSGAYHSGFNHGYNCAESTNFATRSWIEHGVHANSCQCREDAVAIDMRMFSDVATPRVRKLIRETIYSESEESESESESDDSDDESASEEEANSGDESGASSGSEQEIPASRPQAGRQGTAAANGSKATARRAAQLKKQPAQSRKRPEPPAKEDPAQPRKRGRPAAVKDEQQAQSPVRGRGRPAGIRASAAVQSSSAPVNEEVDANSKLDRAAVGTRKSTRAGRGQIRRVGDLLLKVSLPEAAAEEHDDADGGSEQSTFEELPSPCSSAGKDTRQAAAESACKRQVFKA